MARRHDHYHPTAPERAVLREERLRADRSGAVRWFNLRQQHAAGQHPNALQAALAPILDALRAGKQP